MDSCAICHTTHARPNRMGGLGVCDVCLHGGAADAVAHRGWRITSHSWTSRRNKQILHHCEVKAQPASAGPLKATFRMKGSLDALLRALYRSWTDDPAFDRLVYVSTSTADQTAAFLRDDGAQSAIMDLVGERAKVWIADDRVQARATSAEAHPDPVRLEAEVAVLMVHVEAFALSGGAS